MEELKVGWHSSQERSFPDGHHKGGGAYAEANATDRLPLNKRTGPLLGLPLGLSEHENTL